MPQAVMIQGMAQLAYVDKTVVYYISEDYFTVYTFQKNRGSKNVETTCESFLSCIYMCFLLNLSFDQLNPERTHKQHTYPDQKHHRQFVYILYNLCAQINCP
jgi:hypothetical protein